MSEEHSRYIDVHPSVLAHNVVTSLIHAKGHINKWDALLSRLLQEMHGEIRDIEWHLLHAEAELANAHWTLKRISGRTQYAEHGEDTEDQQALREIGGWCRKELGR